MFFAINNGNIILNNGVANYGYYKESKDYVDVIQADVALTATERLSAHYLAGLLTNELIISSLTEIYPFLGGSSSTNKWNLLNLQNTDSAKRLVFYNSPTHDVFGVGFNGTNQWAETFVIPNSFTNGIFASAYVSKDSTDTLNESTLLGSKGGNESVEFSFRWSSAQMLAVATNKYSVLDIAYLPTNRATKRGSFSINVSNEILVAQKDDVLSYFNGNAFISNSLSTRSIFLGACKYVDNNPYRFSNKTIGIVVFGNALSLKKYKTANDIIKFSQKILNRA